MRDKLLLEKTASNTEQCMYSLDMYFVSAGFIDLLPTALRIAGELNFGVAEVIEAICKVSDKYRQYPPTRNRAAWFEKVFTEKLGEARADILAYKEGGKYR
ncbi:MAG: hypothetical protein XD84_1666 [Desulfotomaculum sp. 46_80]|nr:MAG: hypothetical protein XD84_1666 [Desulfotomaculum sp. 46_80]